VPSSAAKRLFAAALSVSVALAGGFLLLRPRTEEPDPLAVPGDLFALLRERAAAEPLEPLAPELVPRREPILRDVAERIAHQLRWPDHEYDPVLVYRWSGGVERRFALPEHARGGFTLRTNSRGMRSPEPAAEKPALRVLFAGDSQTEGYCDDEETFPALVSVGLCAALASEDVEVLNAGCGGYSFYHHLATLERHLDLAPDVFVQVCFAGNDFGESLTLRHFFERLAPPEGFAADAETGRRLRELGGSFLNQGLLQADLLRRLPAERAVAAAAARETAQAIGRLCAERGMRYAAVYLPPVWDAQPGLQGDAFTRAAELLGLTKEDLARVGELGREWQAAAEAAGARVVDLTPALAASDEPLFYRADHHLNARGCALVAERLLPVLEELAR
jgi:lysophospholipase L1-like esterase